MGTVYVSFGWKVDEECVPAASSPRHVPLKTGVQYVLNAESSTTGTASILRLFTIAVAAGSTCLNVTFDGESTVIASVCTSVPIRINAK